MAAYLFRATQTDKKLRREQVVGKKEAGEVHFQVGQKVRQTIKELYRKLINNVQDFLMELGRGFAFVGRECRLVVGKTEQYIDILFYSIKNHCYVVVEVKVTDFEPRDMGQLATYVAIVDDMIREKKDNATVGLLICKTNEYHNGRWDEQNFQSNYTHQFLSDLKANSEAQILLQKLKEESRYKDIVLACFCENENMCHRSLVKQTLLSMGAYAC